MLVMESLRNTALSKLRVAIPLTRHNSNAEIQCGECAASSSPSGFRWRVSGAMKVMSALGDTHALLRKKVTLMGARDGAYRAQCSTQCTGSVSVSNGLVAHNNDGGGERDDDQAKTERGS